MRKAGSRSWTRLATAGMLGLAGFAVYGGAAEPAADNARLPQITSVTHTPSEPHSDEPVRITANVRFRPSKVTLNYQLVDPGEYIDLKDAAFETNWIGMPMADRGAEDPARTGDGLFTATLPAGLQRHRRLVRYRISVVDSAGRTHRAPGSGATRSGRTWGSANSTRASPARRAMISAGRIRPRGAR